jgi:glycosyltransferase involved in cell wall biosynthesis
MRMAERLPISAVVPTMNRAAVLRRALESLNTQSALPAEIIVVDASSGEETRNLCKTVNEAAGHNIHWIRASAPGGATQRNQGVAVASQPVIWFFDDDIIFESDCVSRLWLALLSDSRLGGVNAMIVNQRYLPPGVVSALVFRLLHGQKEPSYAGKVIGPAVNLLPEDREDLPDVVSVEWLNTTCTLYRREALPDPPFTSQFSGYSLMEDLALSLVVGCSWKLANARKAKIYHDSQPADYKAQGVALAKMELINRHYVMTQILGRDRASDYLRLLAWDVFQLAVCGVRSVDRGNLTAMWRGKWSGWREIWSKKVA